MSDGSDADAHPLLAEVCAVRGQIRFVFSIAASFLLLMCIWLVVGAATDYGSRSMTVIVVLNIAGLGLVVVALGGALALCRRHDESRPGE